MDWKREAQEEAYRQQLKDEEWMEQAQFEQWCKEKDGELKRDSSY